eukprot:UN04260
MPPKNYERETPACKQVSTTLGMQGKHFQFLLCSEHFIFENTGVSISFRQRHEISLP